MGQLSLAPEWTAPDDRSATDTCATVVGQERSHWQLLCLSAVAAVLPYLNALAAGFVFDDEPVILANPVITGSSDPWDLIAVPYYPQNLYRPLTLLTYALNEHFAPGNAVAFHAVNLVLHLAVTWAVYALGVVLCGGRAVGLVAALLFAVHPIHTEAVTAIVGRAELLAALWGLLALLAALMTVRPERRRSGCDAMAVLAFAVAVFSKESAATVLPLIVLCRASQRGRSIWDGLAHELRSRYWMPFAAVLALFLIARTYVVGSLTLPTPPIPLDNMLVYLPTMVRLRTATAILADYGGLLLTPIVLSADYSWRQVVPVASWLSLRAIGGLGLMLASGLTFLVCAKRRPVVSVLAIFPFVALVLTCNLFFPIGTVKAERLLYFPSVGCALLVAYSGWCVHGWGAGRVGRTMLAIVLIAYAVRTWVRNADWKDNVTLFQATVDVAPQSAKAHYDLAIFLTRLNRSDEAAPHLRRAVALYENYDDAAFAIGLAYQTKELANGAEAWYRKTLAINPGHTAANRNLCSLLVRQQQFGQAEVACRRGLRFAPASPELLKGLGASLLGQGDRARALVLFRRSLARNPADDELRGGLARLESSDAQ